MQRSSFLFYCMHKSSNDSLLYSPIATTAGNTLKDQLEQLETSLQHNQKVMEAQKKTHNQLYLQIKNLEQCAQRSFTGTIQKIDEQIGKTLHAVAYLQKQANNDYDSLEMQKQQLEDSHKLIANRAKQLAVQCQNLVENVGL